ncbi:MAG TPA: PLDc N-terminal domain-containing protein [Ktedonobacterales bacterium]|nr:PLDc N-terminal domain-containing protein [Ktedonobacterales bacterium]HEX5570413.1 PLDc N-terminal domain-containing protein [Ktedonobacterales bacterium]
MYTQEPTAQPTAHRNLLVTIALILICVLLPVVGHIVLTVFIATDYMSRTEKVIWLIVVWLLWGIGPLIYLLVGQRRNRLFGGHAVL